jgi:hypothetical protein
MAEKWDVEIGEIVQIAPDALRGPGDFGACLVVVTEAKPWGIQGYVKNAGNAGQAYIRVKWEDMERTHGRAVWAAGLDGEDGTDA